MEINDAGVGRDVLLVLVLVLDVEDVDVGVWPTTVVVVVVVVVGTVVVVVPPPLADAGSDNPMLRTLKTASITVVSYPRPTPGFSVLAVIVMLTCLISAVSAVAVPSAS